MKRDQQARTNDHRNIIDRCNLTVLYEPGQEDLAGFLATQKVEITASLPCYLEDNVQAQRGKDAYDKSIHALQQLNQLGYGLSEPGEAVHGVFEDGPLLERDLILFLLDVVGVRAADEDGSGHE